MKTRILAVITQGELGGAQQFLAQLINGLNPEKFEFSVAWGSQSSNELASILPPATPIHHLTHLVRSWNPSHDILAIGEIQKLIGHVAPHVVFSLSSKAGFIASWATKRHNRIASSSVASVYRIGGWAFNDPRPWWERTLYQSLERISAPWKDVIVVNNTHDLQQAQHLGIHPRRQLRCIHNGISPRDPSNLSKHEARNELAKICPGIDLERPIVGTIANFYPTKDIPNLLRSITRLDSGVQAVIIGDGPERNHIEDVIRLLRLEHRVFVAGRIAQASRFLTAFDIFTLPSRKEGFSWALLEAIRARIPIVATNVGAATEIITNGISGLLVPAGDWRGLGDGIALLLKDSSRAQAMTEQAYQVLLSHFTIDRMIQQYEELFLAGNAK